MIVSKKKPFLGRRPEGGAESLHAVGFGTVQPQRLRRHALFELEREHAHAHEVGSVDALEALRQDRPHAQEARPLGRPVPGGASAILLPGDDDERRAVGLVAHRRVVD